MYYYCRENRANCVKALIKEAWCFVNCVQINPRLLESEIIRTFYFKYCTTQNSWATSTMSWNIWSWKIRELKLVWKSGWMMEISIKVRGVAPPRWIESPYLYLKMREMQIMILVIDTTRISWIKGCIIDSIWYCPSQLDFYVNIVGWG